ncbi:16S rRNA (guanine(527)-N(7))-methyltransferase RsmG [Mycoplasma elephantis]|uniref:16S rRNA (guanine(527)-N(7))-methyltransferase RsmG n=1 Tax=Mycoplasma elephantis TaxID=114882 RepID=UPI00055E2F70|nr:16S rRNA (guanine(527)-N(7))-methyltransferase RsmG [Mycoplasma elephantis]
MVNFEKLVENNYPNYFLKLKKYVSLIEKYNLTMNLTGFEKDILWKDVIYESIKFLEKLKINNNDNWVDVGSGAGFPCIPFLICNSNLKLTILEPMLKRVNFLKIIAKELDLNIEVFPFRAENFKSKHIFSVITARAVTSLKNLILSTYHLGTNNALFGFIKGKNIQLEIGEAKKVVEQLNLDLKIINMCDTLKDLKIVSYNKKNKTPTNFPLTWNNILKY